MVVKANTASDRASTYLPTPGMAASKPLGTEQRAAGTAVPHPTDHNGQPGHSADDDGVDRRCPSCPPDRKTPGWCFVRPPGQCRPCPAPPRSEENTPRHPHAHGHQHGGAGKTAHRRRGAKAWVMISSNAAGMRSKNTPSTHSTAHDVRARTWLAPAFLRPRQCG